MIVKDNNLSLYNPEKQKIIRVMITNVSINKMKYLEKCIRGAANQLCNSFLGTFVITESLTWEFEQLFLFSKIFNPASLDYI